MRLLKLFLDLNSLPLPASKVRQLGLALINQNWNVIENHENSDDKEVALHEILNKVLDECCPTKTVRIRPQVDKPFITKELKTLDRQRKREYRKHRKSEKYINLNHLYEAKYKKASKDYLDKMMLELEDANPSKANKLLKRLGAQPGDSNDDDGFTLPEHENLGLSAAQSADKIAQKFAEISQEFPPIEIESLPQSIQTKITEASRHEVPFISRQLIEKKIRNAKTTKGGVAGDLPARLIKEFSHELAFPLSNLYKTIAETGKWPQRWKIEQGLPLKKIDNPQSEDDLRIISLTPFFSKTFEQIVLDWLHSHIGDKLDINQFGGRKGTSVNHYIIELITFILYNQDLPETRAVLAIMVDFSKAFNRQNHNILITKLNDMGVPGWLLKIVFGFLDQRKLVVSFKGAKSESKDMPGGGPQGTVLGMYLFLILINDAGFDLEKTKNFGEKLTAAATKREEMEKMHAKYVDDLTAAQSINLKDDLRKDDHRDWPKPSSRRDRFEQVLPVDKNKIQHQLDDLERYAKENEMKLNSEKTKVMLFNASKLNDFMPEVKVKEADENIEVVEEFKLLGVRITSDLKWDANTNAITKKAFKRLWMLRRLKNLGLKIPSLVKIYTTQVRSLLEYGAVSWHSMLTIENEKAIERVQKSAIAIILGAEYENYEQGLSNLSLQRLDLRRKKLCTTFARKAANHPLHSNWFQKNDLPIKVKTRSQKQTYKPVRVRTQRLLRSPIPYMTMLLNTS